MNVKRTSVYLVELSEEEVDAFLSSNPEKAGDVLAMLTEVLENAVL